MRTPKPVKAGPAAAETSPTAARIAASRARRIAREAAMDWLASTYPLAFGADVKPVAIGVGKLIWPDAKAAGIKRRGFIDALSRRAASLAYLEALAADGAMRVGPRGRCGRGGVDRAPSLRPRPHCQDRAPPRRCTMMLPVPTIFEEDSRPTPGRDRASRRGR